MKMKVLVIDELTPYGRIETLEVEDECLIESYPEEEEVY